MLVKIGGVLIAKNISHLDSTHLFTKSDFLKKCVYMLVVCIVCLMCESVGPVHTLACVWRSEDGFLVITLSSDPNLS